MDVLFYSRNCSHCETLFRSGLVSPTTVKMVPVEAAMGRLPPEVHSVPALWLAKNRQVLLGPNVLQYFKQRATSSLPHAPSQNLTHAKSEPSGCFLGDGGVGGAFSAIAADDDLSHVGGAFEPIVQSIPSGNNGRPSIDNVTALQSLETRDKDARGSLSTDLESFKSQRDAELNDILSRQRPGP